MGAFLEVRAQGVHAGRVQTCSRDPVAPSPPTLPCTGFLQIFLHFVVKINKPRGFPPAATLPQACSVQCQVAGLSAGPMGQDVSPGQDMSPAGCVPMAGCVPGAGGVLGRGAGHQPLWGTSGFGGGTACAHACRGRRTGAGGCWALKPRFIACRACGEPSGVGAWQGQEVPSGAVGREGCGGSREGGVGAPPDASGTSHPSELVTAQEGELVVAGVVVPELETWAGRGAASHPEPCHPPGTPPFYLRHAPPPSRLPSITPFISITPHLHHPFYLHHPSPPPPPFTPGTPIVLQCPGVSAPPGVATPAPPLLPGTRLTRELVQHHAVLLVPKVVGLPPVPALVVEGRVIRPLPLPGLWVPGGDDTGVSGCPGWVARAAPRQRCSPPLVTYMLIVPQPDPGVGPVALAGDVAGEDPAGPLAVDGGQPPHGAVAAAFILG